MVIPLKVREIKMTDAKANLYFKLDLIGNNNLADYKCRIYVDDSPSSIIQCDTLTSIFIPKSFKSFYLMFIKEPVKPT